jgi:hypothetical protein
LVEKKIGQLAVESFDGPTGVKWVKGAGSMVFGEFVNFPDFDHDANIPEGSSLPPRKHKHAYMFTRVISPAGTRTAICMYGSMKNFAGCIVEAGTPREEGWVSSAAPDILQMLETRAATPRYNRAELAYVALDALVGQGLSDSRDHQHPPDLLDNGWRRGFSYGDVQDVAEWFAEVILDEGLS